MVLRRTRLAFSAVRSLVQISTKVVPSFKPRTIVLQVERAQATQQAHSCKREAGLSSGFWYLSPIVDRVDPNATGHDQKVPHPIVHAHNGRDHAEPGHGEEALRVRGREGRHRYLVVLGARGRRKIACQPRPWARMKCRSYVGTRPSVLAAKFGFVGTRASVLAANPRPVRSRRRPRAPVC